MKEIKLTKGYVSIVDDEDFVELSKYKWQYHLGYAKRGIYNKEKRNNDNIKMHTQIMNTPKGLVVHHINHNRLDNRKDNLRICSVRDNHKSQKQPKSGRGYTSKYQGVYLRKKTGSWCARIKVDYKNILLGDFKIEKHAAAAYNEAAKKYFGDFAVLNDVGDIKFPNKNERKINSLKNLTSFKHHHQRSRIGNV